MANSETTHGNKITAVSAISLGCWMSRRKEENMRELIGFEITKLLRKPLIWASLAGMLFLMILMAINWVIPGYASVQEEINGEWVVLENFDAIARNKEIAEQFGGPLTKEKVQEIIEASVFSTEILLSKGLDPDRQRYYTHNSMYLALNDFEKMDGSYNGATVEEVYGNLAQELVIGYYDGWESTLYALTVCFMSWGCVIVIILTPVFAEEYTKRTDALILTGRRGRNYCPAAKVIAAYVVSLIGSVILLGFFALAMLAAHGTAGFDTSVQLGSMGIFFNTPYIMIWGQIFAFACMLWLGATVVLIALCLVVSALAKNSFSALVIAFTLFVLPMFIPWNYFPKLLALAGMLLPINQMEIWSLTDFAKLDLGGFQLNVMWLALPVAFIATIIGVLWSRRAFAKHQVL